MEYSKANVFFPRSYGRGEYINRFKFGRTRDKCMRKNSIFQTKKYKFPKEKSFKKRIQF